MYYGGLIPHLLSTLMRNKNCDRLLELIRYCRRSLISRPLLIRALASARGSVARRAQRPRRKPLEGPKGPRVAKTRESEGPTGAKICRGFQGKKSRCRDKPKCQISRHCRGKNRKNRGDVAAKIVKIAGLSRRIS